MSEAASTRLRSVFDRPYPLLVLSVTGWAATAVAGRLAVGHVSPNAIVTLRLLIVLLVLPLVAREVIVRDWRALLAHWRYVLPMGAIGYTLFSVFFYWAAHRTTAINMGMVQGTSPGLILVGGFLVFGTRFSLRQALGVVVTLIGVAIVASHGSWEALRALELNLGDLAVFGAALCYSGYTIALRWRPPVSPMALFAGMTFAAFLTSLPLLALEGWQGALLWPDAYGWALMLFIGLIPSFLSQIGYMRGVALIGPGRAGVFINLMPVIAAILGVVVLGETFAPYHAVALAFVLGGIWLAERRAADA
jgi:drug/metabolite transporter (DMT)-like permease